MRRLHKLSVLVGAQLALAALAMGWDASPKQGPYVSTLHSSFGVRIAVAGSCGDKCYSSASCGYSNYMDDICVLYGSGCSTFTEDSCIPEGS